jgi:nitrate/TMAO reductase-like tetraheme cytochrome c subunit
MATLAADPHYSQSPHRANAEGVRPSCGACHIPATNWFSETYAHAIDGIKDIAAEVTHNYGDTALWEARRIELAHAVRENMRHNDSVTCRNCHDAGAIKPTSERGRAAHALLRERRLTCIDCHFNLVHAPVPPSMSFIRGSGLGDLAK